METRFVLAGRLRRDYLLPPAGRPLVDAPGGGLLYAASGLTVWERGLGLLARVGEDYPTGWLRDFARHGWDTRGVRVLAEALDLRYFQACLDLQTVQRSNPVAHFARLGLTFPKSLLGYTPRDETADDRKTSPADAPRPGDIPDDYLNAAAVHLCPLDFMTANRLTSAFRQAGVSTLTLDPSAAYLTPAALEDVRSLLHGLTAFLPAEEELRALFWGRTTDLWEMAEAAVSFGCEFIVVKRGARGQMLYDSASKKRWEIPAYPARLADLTGAGDAFCGGFLAGFVRTLDPLRAVLHGNISASLAVEGTGALYALETLPGLAQARLQSLAATVRQV